MSRKEVSDIEKITKRTFWRRFDGGKGLYNIFRYIYSANGGRGGKTLQIGLSCLTGEGQNRYLKKNQEPGAGSHESGAQSENLPAVAEPTAAATIDRIVTPPALPDHQDPWHALPEACREKAYDLLLVVNRARDIRARAKKKGKTRAMKALAAEAGISVGTLYNHVKKADAALAAAQDAGADTIFAQVKALSYRYGTNRNRFRSFDEPAIAFALAEHATQKLPCMRATHRRTVEAGAANGWRVGSYNSLVAILKRLDPATTTLARKGKKRHEADHIVKILRNYEEIWPNFMWCGDHHIFDVFVKLADGKGGWQYRRPWLTAWLDMASRSFMGWCISFKPNSRTIAMALAHGISEKDDPNFPQHGLPQSVYIDNGKDYRAKYLNGEDIRIGKIDYPEIMERYAALGIDPFYIDLEYDPAQAAWIKKRGRKHITIKGVRVGGVYARLGIGQHYATAYHPWAKPIERAFRTVVQQFSRDLPGWCGSGHEQRPEKLAFELKRGTALTFEEFCERWHDWVVNEYHKRPHRGHGMNGLTPDQAFSSRLPQPQTVEPTLLDFALMKKERVKIHPWGFNLNGRQFEPDVPVSLYGAHVLNRLIGAWATVYFDYDHKTVRIYQDGKHICNGKPLARASFIDPDNPVMEEKLRMQAYQKQVSRGMLEVIHSRPEAEAGTTDEALLIMTHGEAEDQRAEDRRQTAEEDVIPITADERYRQILRRRARGGELSERDRVFCEEFEKGQQYLVSKDLYQAEFEYQQYLHANGGAT